MKDEIKEEYINDLEALMSVLASAYDTDNELFNNVYPVIVIPFGDKTAIHGKNGMQVIHFKGTFDLWIGSGDVKKMDASIKEVNDWILKGEIK